MFDVVPLLPPRMASSTPEAVEGNSFIIAGAEKNGPAADTLNSLSASEVEAAFAGLLQPVDAQAAPSSPILEPPVAAPDAPPPPAPPLREEFFYLVIKGPNHLKRVLSEVKASQVANP